MPGDQYCDLRDGVRRPMLIDDRYLDPGPDGISERDPHYAAARKAWAVEHGLDPATLPAAQCIVVCDGQMDVLVFEMRSLNGHPPARVIGWDGYLKRVVTVPIHRDPPDMYYVTREL